MKLLKLTPFLIVIYFLFGFTHLKHEKVPEFANQIMLVSDQTSELVELENSEAVVRTTGTAFKSNLVYFYKGEKSPIQLSSKNRIKFIVKMTSDDIDPKSLVKFGQFKKRKNRREMIFLSGNANGMVSQLSSKNLSFSKVEPKVYEITINQQLQPGEEYALICANRMYAFGISE